MRTSSSRALGAWLAAAALLLAGCASHGQTEASCQSPVLIVSPDPVAPGGTVTITWDGLVECGGEPITPGGSTDLHIGLAEFHGYPTEPFTPPPPIVSDWAEMQLPTGSPAPGPSPSPSTTATVPPDLPPGEYSAFVEEDFLRASTPFTVSG